jgi:hypothetical protein
MSILLRNNFSDLTLADALPALKKVTEDLFGQFPMAHESIFNMGSMDKGIVQHTGVSGIPAVGQVGEGAEYPIDQMVQGYDKTFTAVKFGVMLGISEELLEDSMVDVFKRRPEQLARAMDEAIRIQAAAIFNNAFTTNGPDGSPLCSKTHALAYPGAGTSSNQLSTDADLSQSSLEDLITVMRGTKDNAGKKVLVRPTQLIVPPELEFLAHELLESTQKPQASTGSSITEENMINAVRSRYGLVPVVMDYLTDADAFFLASEKSNHNLWWYWRKRPEVTADEEFKSDIGLLKIKSRFAVGFSDWRGIAGTTGA